FAWGSGGRGFNTRILRRPSQISMHLAHVEVRNFRCLRALRVDLQQGLNVLVRRNNVGKTSLLAAIRHALGASAGRGEALWLTEDVFHCPGPGGFPSMYFFIRETNDMRRQFR